MSCRGVSWSELPPELLPTIAERLESRSDIQHFRAVCKTWWRTASFRFLMSKNIISPLFPHCLSDSYRRCFHHNGHGSPVLVASSVFLLQPTFDPKTFCFFDEIDPKTLPWLFSGEELNPRKLLVKKSILPICSENLPPYIPRTLDLSNIRVSELARFYNFRFGNKPPLFDSFPRFNPSKVVLFENPNTNCPTIGDCTAMVLQRNGALFAISLKDDQHELHVNFKGRMFDDIVNYNGMIYAIDRKGRAYKMAYDTLSMSNFIDKPLCEVMSEKRKRLAVSSDHQELYLIRKCCRKSTKDVAFNIYKLNEEQRKWDEIEGIGDDRILFVTFDGCFFALANQFPGWTGNCIVFYHACFAAYSPSRCLSCEGCSYLDVYHFNSSEDLEHLDADQSRVFWPPPIWLASNECIPKRKYI